MTEDWITRLRDAQERSTSAREAVIGIEDEFAQGGDRDSSVAQPDQEAVRAQLAQDPGTRNTALVHVTDHTGDAKRVFVVHGRNLRARNAVFQFLRSVGLHPL